MLGEKYMSNMRELLDKLNELTEDDGSVQLHDSFDIEINENFVIETGVIGFTEDGIVLEADEQTLSFLEVNDILTESEELDEEKPGLWANIHAKRNRIKSGSGERMRKPGSKGAPSAQDFKDAAKTSNESLDLEEGRMKDMMWADAERMELEVFLDKYAHSPEDIEWLTDFYNSALGIDNMDDMGADHTDDMLEAEYQGRKVPLGKPMAGDVKKSKVYVKKPNGKVVKVNFGDKNMKIKKSNPNRRKSFRARHRCENPGPRWKARYWSCRAW